MLVLYAWERKKICGTLVREVKDVMYNSYFRAHLDYGGGHYSP